jgi:hypothetical protein
MFNPMVSAPFTGPPAACSASAMRAPGARVTSPGVCTRPTTPTTTGRSVPVGWPAPGLADDLGPAVAAFSTGGSLADITGAGRSRTRVNTVISTARAATIASAMTPARPGSARILATQPRRSDASGSHRGSSEFWSSSVASSDSSVGSARESVSGSAPSRRCSRSTGSSVRMRRP